uniref:Putative secreted peptide n=1 Tax=Anopheles braziliensis TaxID=58242 RepID=A0A2M3ZX82_9DIPT
MICIRCRSRTRILSAGLGWLAGSQGTPHSIDAKNPSRVILLKGPSVLFCFNSETTPPSMSNSCRFMAKHDAIAHTTRPRARR